MSTEKKSVKVGDVLYRSGGYNRTDVEFYVVTRKAGNAIFARKCDEQLSGKEQVVPVPTKLVGREERFSFARENLISKGVWDGQPKWFNDGYQGNRI